MSPFESLKSAIGSLESQQGPNEIPQEDFDKLKNTLAQARKVVENVKESKDLDAKEKARRLKAAAGILRTTVIEKRLEGWKAKYPSQKDKIDKAIAAVEKEAQKYEAEAKVFEESTTAKQNASEEVAPKTPSITPGPEASKEVKERFWKGILAYRKPVYRDGGGVANKIGIPDPFNVLANRDSIARRLTNSIKNLDEETAKILVKYTSIGQYLCLDGVKNLTENVAKILGGKGINLSLKGLDLNNRKNLELLRILHGNFGYKYITLKGGTIETKEDSKDPYCMRSLTGWGLIKENGEIIELKYDDTWNFSEGLAVVKKDGKWGYINKEGKEITELKYDDTGDFSEGLAVVKKDGKWGYINKEGKEIIELKYDYTWNFSEGLAVVKKNDKWGYINKEGKEITELKYDNTWNFSEGLARVEKDGKWGYINKEGNEIISPEYDDVGHLSGTLFRVRKGNECQFIDIENP